MAPTPGLRTEAVSPAALANDQLLKRLAAAILIIGGITTVIGVLTTSPSDASLRIRVIIGTLFVVGGIGVRLAPARRAIVEIAILVSIGLLSLMTATLDPVGMVAFFYLWPLVFAAYFCSTQFWLTAMAFMTVTLGAALVATPHVDTKVDVFSATLISVFLMGGLVRLMQRRERALRRRLERAADTDPLTGLMNRRSFNPALEELVQDGNTAGKPLCVLLLDLDHFKQYNDTHGHLAGDRALERAAAILARACPPATLISRFGGEEFAITLPGGDLGATLALAERIGARFQQEDVREDQRLSVSAGIGPQSGSTRTFDAILTSADEALYAAKAAGRGRAAWWSGDDLIVGDPYTRPFGPGAAAPRHTPDASAAPS